MIGFTTPLILLSLLVLPVLFYILRAIPPAPVRHRFPAVRLLAGLKEDAVAAQRTPWWLLLVRLLALAALCVGLAGPHLKPEQQPPVPASSGPKLILIDNSWAGAAQHDTQQEWLKTELERAAQKGQPVAVLSLSDPKPLIFQSAQRQLSQRAGFQLQPWQPSPKDVARALEFISDVAVDEIVWISDGVHYTGHQQLLQQLKSQARLKVYQTTTPVFALSSVTVQEDRVTLQALRSRAGAAQNITVHGHGTDPAGRPQILIKTQLHFAQNATTASSTIAIPSELRARIRQFEISPRSSAAAVFLLDDAFARKEVALIAQSTREERANVLSDLHYLRQALAPSTGADTDLIEGTISQVLPAAPDVIILADVVNFTAQDESALLQWMHQGGTLLRFAGPKMAASSLSRETEHPLMPVRLRTGGRSLTGAMSWGSPKAIAEFERDSPFFGLPVPKDVWINTQVVAQPDPNLSARVIARLEDGTPLITRKFQGAGQVVLIHVSANATWSSLPLSGLFLQLLERIIATGASAKETLQETDARLWQPQHVLDGFGALHPPKGLLAVTGQKLHSTAAQREVPPGVYTSQHHRIAKNVLHTQSRLTPIQWPSDVLVNDRDAPVQIPLMAPLLLLALALILLDILAMRALSGRLWKTALILCMFGVLPSEPLQAQENAADVALAAEIALAYVKTGNERVDRISHEGLAGLSKRLKERTSVEPQAPVAVDLASDELALFPLLYWPMDTQQPRPDAQAIARLNSYLRLGGTIVFDTRDAGLGQNSQHQQKLRDVTEQLNIPPLETIPHDHVLTRAYYLLSNFPGRHDSMALWVEAAPFEPEGQTGKPFRNLNDGVSPVLIGANDWASAWAIDETGQPLYPVGRGFAGERQRELAFRFGINLVMYVLTGNYKSDQVHVPELLKRLGK